jgi:hypothetical protein
MKIVIPATLEQRTVLHGTVNGESFKMRGGGMGAPHEGTVATDLTTNPGPVNFKMGLMAPCIIMGFPTFSKYPKGTHDLFKISDGYEYERHLRFENGGKLDTVSKVTYVGPKKAEEFQVEHVEGDFEVNGNVEAPDLVSVEPLVEIFESDGPGEIKSTFKIVWRTADGGTFAAQADNHYHLKHKKELPFRHQRRIEFDAQFSPDRIRQSERLTMSPA